MAHSPSRILKTLTLVLAIVVTAIVMAKAGGFSFDAGVLMFMAWAFSPYVMFYFASELLRKFTKLASIEHICLGIAALMLAFTLFAYGSLNGESATESLVFVFAPLYIFAGSLALLAVTLPIALLVSRQKS